MLERLLGRMRSSENFVSMVFAARRSGLILGFHTLIVADSVAVHLLCSWLTGALTGEASLLTKCDEERGRCTGRGWVQIGPFVPEVVLTNPEAVTGRRVVAPQGHFRRTADIPEYRFRVCEGDVCDAPRGNGWDRETSCRAPGFGLLLGITRVDGIPWRNFGSRTAALVRSVLRRGHPHVFWRVSGMCQFQ